MARRKSVRQTSEREVGMFDMVENSFSSTQESVWEELRGESRKVEGDLDVKLSNYAKLGARKGALQMASPSSGSWKSMEMEVKSLLGKLLDRYDSMSRCAASAAPTTSVSQKLSRHNDILYEFTQGYFIPSSFPIFCIRVLERSLVQERAAKHGSISHNDDAINQAQATRAVLGSL
ncbi:Golgi SNAP receptor complex member 1-2-like isoform X3 [Salvia divinorum]|uniref:Golgi SNAP receptor complex member 1-2-like isoform X3 n=1 Tax=Salvia divinorum TaxID=28513 RepID=A0ABD1GH09_SALDI